MGSKILGLTVFWIIGTILADFLGPTADTVVALIILAVTLAVIGSMVLSSILGGDGLDHLFAGFMLALPGWLLTHFGFHWYLSNPARACTVDAVYTCGFGAMLGTMLLNVLIVAVGMAIICIPVLPLIWKLHRQQ
jgi:hypothetical protein